MTTVAYVVLGIFGLVAIWWVFKVAVGVSLPIETTARAYFKQLLKKMEIDQIVPLACTVECIGESISFARKAEKFSGKNYDLRTEVVKQLELHADMLRLWIRGNDTFDAVYKMRFKAMFERYAVPRLG